MNKYHITLPISHIYINIITFLRKATPLLDKNKLVSFKFKPRDTLQTYEKGKRTRHANISFLSQLLFDIKKDIPTVLPPNEHITVS